MKRTTLEQSESIRRARSTVIFGLVMLIFAGYAHGQASLDFQALIQDTQRMSPTPDEMTLIWWLPEQFWQASQAQDPSITKEQIDQFLETISPYTMLAVVDGEMGTFGGVTFKSEEAVRSSVTIKDAEGVSYAPLGDSAIDADMKNLLNMLKPVITNMIGPMGENMHFLLFKSKGKDGHPLADPTSEGTFRVNVAGKDYDYRLPLGSVLPPKYDPKTKEKFPGNYNYNPITGSKLVTEPLS